jgi:integral membrane sensor domain MASE1
MLPFTREQFLGVFVTYNDAIWPLQIVTYLLGIVVVVALLFRHGRPSDRIIAGVLAAM